jgi:hypothetical protein
MTSQELDRLAALVMDEHEQRLDVCETVPLKRREYSLKRPNMAILGEGMVKSWNIPRV